MAKLIVNMEKSLIQHNGKTYNVPTRPDLRNELGFRADVFKKRFELAQNMGLDLYEDGSFNCTDCQHTGIFGRAKKKGVIATRSTEDFCKYDGKDAPHWLSYYYKEGETGFAARMNPCIADASLLLALIDLKYFDQYFVKTKLDLSKFPYARDVFKSRKSFVDTVNLYNQSF